MKRLMCLITLMALKGLLWYNVTVYKYVHDHCMFCGYNSEQNQLVKEYLIGQLQLYAGDAYSPKLIHLGLAINY